jgi:hypothetical protein
MWIIGSVSVLAIFLVSDWLMRNDDDERFGELVAKAWRQLQGSMRGSSGSRVTGLRRLVRPPPPRPLDRSLAG